MISCKKGGTLVEIIVAILLLSILFLTFMPILSSISNKNKNIIKMKEINRYAENAIEIIKAIKDTRNLSSIKDEIINILGDKYDISIINNIENSNVCSYEIIISDRKDRLLNVEYRFLQ